MDVRDLDAVLEVADVLQIGARNMQNYPLLAEIGRSGRPALLKRGLSATLAELVSASEYIRKEGNDAVILCERGIRTFETAYRFTLDLAAVPALREMTELPVIVAPRHAPGRRSLVPALSLAAATTLNGAAPPRRSPVRRSTSPLWPERGRPSPPNRPPAPPVWAGSATSGSITSFRSPHRVT